MHSCYVCVCVYIYVCVCACKYIVHVYHVCVCARALTHVRICYTHIYIYVYTHTCMHVCTVFSCICIAFWYFVCLSLGSQIGAHSRTCMPIYLNYIFHFITLQYSAGEYTTLHSIATRSTSLVVDLHLWKMMEFVSWDDHSLYMEK